MSAARAWPWSVDEALLYALTARAWELRGQPGYQEAIDAILEAFDRAPLSWLERCEQRRARNDELIRLLRETNPGASRTLTLPGKVRAA